MHDAREQERGTEVGRAGLCGWAESEARGPFKVKNEIFKLFSIPFSFKRIFELFERSFKLWPKNKVAQKFILYNFAFMTEVKFQLDFELPNKTQY